MIISDEDYKKYEEMQGEFEGSDEKKRELIEHLWLIMNCFVDLAFGQSPLQFGMKDKDHDELREAIEKVIQPEQ